jgi:peptidyl-prolyl cis-trans isomerase SurA
VLQKIKKNKKFQMKKGLVLGAIMMTATAVSAQTLITYGNNTISKQEFLRAYNKNKPSNDNREKSLRDYVDLYTNFKLKVKAASELRIDTLQQIKYDVENFRNQIMENYLSDDAGMKKLEDQAFERSQKDIHVQHFFYPVVANAIPVDTLKAFNAINETYKNLRAGKNNYAKIVAPLPPARQNDIGFITVFSLPYEYENIIYNTRVQEVSKPYHSKNGWHIFKVLDERAATGKWKVAQVLFSFPPESDAIAKAAIKSKADSVYALIQKGMPFGEAAKTYSNDKLTYLTDGEMPEFGAGKYSSDFENHIFDLKKDGDISKPFETSFGYHIVKRLGFIPTPKSMADEAYRLELKQKILQDSRINTERDKFAKEIVEKTGFKKAASVSEYDLFRYADTLMKNPTEVQTENLPISKKTIATFTHGSVKGSDWLKFVREYKANYEQYKGETNKQLWDKFITVTAVDYYKTNLESYNRDFKNQMEEFREGNMLFEIMERNVWNKAISDTAGLIKYYNSNKEKYKWAASADVIVFNCSSKKVAEDAIENLKNGKDWKTIATESNAAIQADSGRYELAQIVGNPSASVPQGHFFSTISTNADNTAVFVKYLKVYPAGEQRNFADAKGLVINDYQTVLEQNWLRQLKIKYPVKVNEVVFKQLITQ